ncbi:DUF4190 domain-containing protein, partial [Rhodococcus koreensis]
LPAGFDAVIARAMAKDRKDRYPSCGALAAAAQQALGPAETDIPTRVEADLPTVRGVPETVRHPAPGPVEQGPRFAPPPPGPPTREWDETQRAPRAAPPGPLGLAEPNLGLAERPSGGRIAAAIGLLLVGVVPYLSPVAWAAGWLVFRNRPGSTYWLLLPAWVLVAPGATLWFRGRQNSDSYETYIAWFLTALGPFYGGSIVSTVFVAAVAKSLHRRQIREASSSPVPPPPPVGKTNRIAILSLILGIVGPLGIVFGHVSLSQIKRSGERGEALALAGLILGYLWFSVIGWLVFLSLPA